MRTRLLTYWVWQPFAWLLLTVISRPIEWVYRYHQWRETLRR